MSDDFESQLRETLTSLRRGLPDPQPGADFWRHVDAQRVRRPWWNTHRVQAVAACLVLVAVVGVAVAALRPSGAGGPAAGSAAAVASPGAPEDCPPGTAVQPTRTPAPAGSAPVVLAVPAHDAPRGVPAGSWQIDSPAFDAVREVGGCVVAWRLPSGTAVPPDATRVSGAHAKQFTRADDAGRTEVYLVTDAGQGYLAISGNITAPDLARALAAAVTEP